MGVHDLGESRGKRGRSLIVVDETHPHQEITFSTRFGSGHGPCDKDELFIVDDYNDNNRDVHP